MSVQRTTTPLIPIQWQKHINLVFRIVKPKQKDTIRKPIVAFFHSSKFLRCALQTVVAVAGIDGLFLWREHNEITSIFGVKNVALLILIPFVCFYWVCFDESVEIDESMNFK